MSVDCKWALADWDSRLISIIPRAVKSDLATLFHWQLTSWSLSRELPSTSCCWKWAPTVFLMWPGHYAQLWFVGYDELLSKGINCTRETAGLHIVCGSWSWIYMPLHCTHTVLYMYRISGSTAHSTCTIIGGLHTSVHHAWHTTWLLKACVLYFQLSRAILINGD